MIVTGAGAGIGRAIAEGFLDAGDRVFVADISDARLEETAADLSRHERLSTHVLDVTDFAAVTQLVQEVVDATGALDVMVNNAGVFDGWASVEETSEALWRKIIEVNLTGNFHGCKAAAAVMIPRKQGRIISIGSVAGQRGAADGLAYAAAKAGIEGLHRRLAYDVGPHNITANVVAPGVIRTDIRANSSEILGDLVDTDRGVGASPELMDFLIPAKRAGAPGEIAAAVVFLASDAAAYINGQVLQIDGGWNAV